jgi:hypothetical protein
VFTRMARQQLNLGVREFLAGEKRQHLMTGRNEMDPPLCGTTAMSHNEFTISEPIEPQEASPMKDRVSYYSRNF